MVIVVVIFEHSMANSTIVLHVFATLSSESLVFPILFLGFKERFDDDGAGMVEQHVHRTKL